MEDLLFLKNQNIHTDWHAFLDERNLNLISEIEKEIIKSDFTPAAGFVLRFLELPLKSARVIIIGQDPYPQPGVATGRAFEVGTLKSWNQPFKNISLKNIMRALYKAYTGDIIKFSVLKEKFDNEFPVLPPGRLFSHWEEQGVLLLNTSFTCGPGTPGSHRHLWDVFTKSLLQYISRQTPEATWFLWGSHAREAVSGLNLKNFIETMHPMMCHPGEGRDNDFLYGKTNCFEQFNNVIDWTGFSSKRESVKQTLSKQKDCYTCKDRENYGIPRI